MNAKPSSAYSNHDEIWLLLPWYVNSSLQSSECKRVQQHLQVCLTCRRELAEQGSLAKRLGHSPRLEISPQPSFERLMSRIRVEGETQAKHKQPPPVKGSAPFDWKQAVLGFLSPKPLAAAFATGMFAGLLAFMMNGGRLLPPASYHTVANVNALPFEPNDIRVIFADNTPDQAIRSLIDSVHGRVLEGPNSMGAYTVRIPADAGHQPLMAEALNQLRADKAVVFAEPALPRPVQPDGAEAR